MVESSFRRNFVLVTTLLVVLSFENCDGFLAHPAGSDGSSMSGLDSAALPPVMPYTQGSIFSDMIPPSAVQAGLTQIKPVDVYVSKGTYQGFSKTYPEQYGELVRLRSSTNDDYLDWNIGIGQGGQLYSILAGPGTQREIVAEQSPGGDWIDRAFQFMAQQGLNTSPSLTYDLNCGGIYETSARVLEFLSGRLAINHVSPAAANCLFRVPDAQAGTYFDGGDFARAGRHEPYFAPLLASDTSATAAAQGYVDTLNLAQRSQIPNEGVSRYLWWTRTRNMGHGIVEMTYVVHNYDKAQSIDSLSVWAPVRDQAFPQQILRSANGDLYLSTANNRLGATSFKKWIVHAENLNAGARAFAFVFGDAAGTGYLGFGSSDPAPYHLKFMDYSRNQNLPPGQTMQLRVYLVFGEADQIQELAERLAPFAKVQTLDFNFDPSKTLLIYSERDAQNRPYLSNVGHGAPVGLTSSVPAPGTQALFLMKNTVDGTYFNSSDPYANGKNLYDSSAQVIAFLGWAFLSDAKVSTSAPRVSLKTLTSTLSAADQTLTLLAPPQ